MHGGSTRYQVKNRQQGIENEEDSGPNQLHCGFDWEPLNRKFLPMLLVSTSDSQADPPRSRADRVALGASV
jgi:hypothetical protein